MSDIAIHVENLGKRYRIGERQRYKALRDTLSDALYAPFRAAASLLHGHNGHQSTASDCSSNNDFWALKDISFEIKQGEAVGIIGRNGAGKSTLLKILSRITKPTEGYIRMHGRVGSLLEVGTGFHPELTGRENAYLNGAIIGMRKKEIDRKFDEILDFAEVGKFVDTPVKLYSSGMYVRLAFAVAAHLEPEILLVDEVLAVGDAAFQKKCLGKMGDVARTGRTVLFVSHNLDAVLKLCKSGVLLTSGRVAIRGPISDVVAVYVEGRLSMTNVVDLRDMRRPLGARDKARLTEAQPGEGQQGWSVPFGQRLKLQLQVEAQQVLENVELGLGLFSALGTEVASWTSTYAGTKLPLRRGSNVLQAVYHDLSLLPGQYYLSIGLRSDHGFEDYLPEAIRFEVVASRESAEASAHTFGGLLVPTVSAHVQK